MSTPPTILPGALPGWAEERARVLNVRLAEVQERYRREAEPYVRELSELEAYRSPPTVIFKADEAPEWIREQLRRQAGDGE